MFNYIELENDDRNRIIKYVSEKEYKRADSHISPPVAALKDAFGQIELSRIDYSTMRSYAYKNCVYPGNEVMKFYNILIDRKLSENVDFHNELISLINDRSYCGLDEEAKEKIEDYRAEYNELEMPFEFDTYIRFLCVPEDSSIEKFKEETVNQMVKEMQTKLDEAHDEYNKLVKNYNEQVKQIRSLNNEIEKLKSEKEKYEKYFSVKNIVKNVSDILPEGFEAKTYREVFEKLNEIESDNYLKNDFEKCREILSAKYAVATIIENKEK